MPKSPASKAGLRTGYEIIKINSIPVKEIIENFTFRPPFNERNPKYLIAEELLRHIYGKPNSDVRLTFRDDLNKLKEVTVTRVKRHGSLNLFANMPGIYLEVKSKMISKKIGYIHFNAFQPDNPSKIIEEIFRMKNLPALIIDVRGNNGGSINALRQLAGVFLSNQSYSYKVTERNESYNIEIEKNKNAFNGKLVVLIDEMSVSAAELFTNCLKKLQRATVIGTRTPGNVLSGDMTMLQDSIALVIPIGEWTDPDGNVLENNGVKPNIVVKLKQSDLLKGIDTQLKSAIKYLENNINQNLDNLISN